MNYVLPPLLKTPVLASPGVPEVKLSHKFGGAPPTNDPTLDTSFLKVIKYKYFRQTLITKNFSVDLPLLILVTLQVSEKRKLQTFFDDLLKVRNIMRPDPWESARTGRPWTSLGEVDPSKLRITYIGPGSGLRHTRTRSVNRKTSID